MPLQPHSFSERNLPQPERRRHDKISGSSGNGRSSSKPIVSHQTHIKQYPLRLCLGIRIDHIPSRSVLLEQLAYSAVAKGPTVRIQQGGWKWLSYGFR